MFVNVGVLGKREGTKGKYKPSNESKCIDTLPLDLHLFLFINHYSSSFSIASLTTTYSEVLRRAVKKEERKRDTDRHKQIETHLKHFGRSPSNKEVTIPMVEMPKKKNPIKLTKLTMRTETISKSDTKEHTLTDVLHICESYCTLFPDHLPEVIRGFFHGA